MTPEECADWLEAGWKQDRDPRESPARVEVFTLAHLRRLAALERALEMAQNLGTRRGGRIAALEAENEALRRALQSLGYHVAPRLARESLEPPVEGVPGLEGGE